MAKLTDKQKRFVDEYLIDLNATQAAIRAGYSPNTAEQAASRLLSFVKVQNAIAVEMADRSKRTGVNQDRVIQELAKIAFANITNIADENAALKTDADEADLAAVESVKVKTIPTKSGDAGVEREIKLASKLKALELLGKHLGMWNDKLDVNLNVPVVFEGESDLEE
jgi:phage terminase small subunit